MNLFPIVYSMCVAAFSAGLSEAAAGKPTVAPYGSWRSPISAQMLVQGAVRFGDLAIDGETQYWVEGRPEEQGRYAIVRRTPDGKVDDILPRRSVLARPFTNTVAAHSLPPAEQFISRIMRTSASGESNAAKRQHHYRRIQVAVCGFCLRWCAQSPHCCLRGPLLGRPRAGEPHRSR